MADQEARSEFNEIPDPESGLLTQDVLDALLAAANEEEPSAPGLSLEDTATPAANDLPGAFSFGGGGGSAIDLPSFDPPPGSSAFFGGPEPVGLTRVRDIPLEVTVELGRTRLLIRDILDLSTGSIIELDKIAGEPVDLFANGLLVARGEVIVIDDNFGVRVTEIITAVDREQSGKEAHAVAA